MLGSPAGNIQVFVYIPVLHGKIVQKELLNCCIFSGSYYNISALWVDKTSLG